MFKCDENCEKCKPVYEVARDMIAMAGGGECAGFDWFFTTDVSMKDAADIDENTKAIMSGFFQVFNISIARKDRRILGVKVTMFGDVVEAYEDLTVLELEDCNDVVRSQQLKESVQRTIGAAVAKFASSAANKFVVTYWDRYRTNYGSARNHDSGDVPF